MDREAFDSYVELEQKHFWRIAKRKLVLQWLEDRKPSHIERVLDIGGAASLITSALENYGSLTVVEPDAEMVKTASQASSLEVIQGGFPELPVSGSFDVITLLDVLEHLEDDLGALLEIRSLLSPGGVFLCTVPAYMWLWSDHDVVLHHKRRYTVSALRSRLQEAGFDVLRISYYTSFLLPLLAIQRLAGKLKRTSHTATSERAVYSVRVPSPLLNSTLGTVMSVERRILRRYRLPTGSAIIAVCQ